MRGQCTIMSKPRSFLKKRIFVFGCFKRTYEVRERRRDSPTTEVLFSSFLGFFLPLNESVSRIALALRKRFSNSGCNPYDRTLQGSKPLLCSRFGLITLESLALPLRLSLFISIPRLGLSLSVGRISGAVQLACLFCSRLIRRTDKLIVWLYTEHLQVV